MGNLIGMSVLFGLFLVGLYGVARLIELVL